MSTVEHVVGRHVHDVSAASRRRLRQRPHPERVHRECLLGITLTGVDAGHGGGIDHHVRSEFTDNLLDLLPLGEVERIARGGENVVTRKGLDHSAPDLAARSGDEDAHGWAVYGPSTGRDPMGRRARWWSSRGAVSSPARRSRSVPSSSSMAPSAP